MRRHGPVQSGAGLGPNGHACWSYSGPEDFQTAAVEFLEDGRRLGQRLAYVGEGTVEKLRGDLAGLDDCAALIDSGALQVMSLGDLYPPGKSIDAEAQLATYAGAVDQSLADGYSGLRVAAEVTALVRDREKWDAHVAWESFADRYMAKHPFAALCCFDREQLDPQVVAQLACVHPSARHWVDLPPFRIYANEDGLILEGEIDVFTVDAFEHLLDLVVTGEITLSLDRLHFADHYAVLALARRRSELERRGVEMRLRGTPRAIERLCDVLSVEL